MGIFRVFLIVLEGEVGVMSSIVLFVCFFVRLRCGVYMIFEWVDKIILFFFIRKFFNCMVLFFLIFIIWFLLFNVVSI